MLPRKVGSARYMGSLGIAHKSDSRLRFAAECFTESSRGRNAITPFRGQAVSGAGNPRPSGSLLGERQRDKLQLPCQSSEVSAKILQVTDTTRLTKNRQIPT